MGDISISLVGLAIIFLGSLTEVRYTGSCILPAGSHAPGPLTTDWHTPGKSFSENHKDVTKWSRTRKAISRSRCHRHRWSGWRSILQAKIRSRVPPSILCHPRLRRNSSAGIYIIQSHAAGREQEEARYKIHLRAKMQRKETRSDQTIYVMLIANGPFCIASVAIRAGGSFYARDPAWLSRAHAMRASLCSQSRFHCLSAEPPPVRCCATQMAQTDNLHSSSPKNTMSRMSHKPLDMPFHSHCKTSLAVLSCRPERQKQPSSELQA